MPKSKTAVAAPPKPELTYVSEDGPPVTLFVILNRDGVWWAPKAAGYRSSLIEAGTFTAEQLRVCCLREGDDIVMPLHQALTEHLPRANPDVLQAIAALGGR